MHFHPLIRSAEGIIYKDSGMFKKKISRNTINEMEKTVLSSTEWQSQFSVIRAISLRFRGSRRKITCLPFEHGVAISYLDFSKYIV